jgi:beta-glucosidase
MTGRTYRYFEGTPLYAFGYGLSYTKFSYSGLTVPSTPMKAGDTLLVRATVTNTGATGGDEVAQLYLSFPAVAGAPLKALRGFERVHLEPGASTVVRFELKPRDLSMVTEAGEPIVAEGAYTVTVGGGQPNAGAPTVSASFNVMGSLTLPE